MTIQERKQQRVELLSKLRMARDTHPKCTRKVVWPNLHAVPYRSKTFDTRCGLCKAVDRVLSSSREPEIYDT